jgi:hypothetical protein
MSCEDRLSQLCVLHEAFRDRVRGTVYHYTSAEGFRGIVANGEIWLTNTAFVNDTTECKAFWELGKKDVFGTGPFPNKYVEASWDRRANMRREHYDNIYYVASFSKAKDMLQQYRAYGSFCIGFKASELMKRGFRLYDCVYDAKQIREWIRSKSVAQQWGGDCLDDQAKSGAAHNLMFAASIKYKSKHYRDEREVRLLSESHHTWGSLSNCPSLFAKDPPIHFRDHPVYKMPIPYAKFFISPSDAKERPHKGIQKETSLQMKRRKVKDEEKDAMLRELLPLKELWIGPMARQEEAKLACEIMLREKGYEDVQVQVAKIPYRGV